MKKIILIFLSAIIALGCFLFFLQPRIEFDDANSATVKFMYKDTNIETTLSEAHTNQIVDIFENKKLKNDSPSCSFTENVSIKIGNQTFCVACDTCRIIYLFEKNRYFYLTDAENDSLRDILTHYGFKFPCI